MAHHIVEKGYALYFGVFQGSHLAGTGTARPVDEISAAGFFKQRKKRAFLFAKVHFFKNQKQSRPCEHRTAEKY